MSLSKPVQVRPDAQCSLCGKVVKGGSKNMWSHLRTHEGRSLSPPPPKIQKVQNQFQCEHCDKMFQTKKYLKQHQDGHCKSGQPAYKYPGGCYESKPTIFDKLLEFGIMVEKDRQVSHSFVVWDCESILDILQLKMKLPGEPCEQTEQRLLDQNIQVEYVDGKAAGRQLRERHIVCTGALKSTVSNETQFFHNENPELLVKEMYKAMVKLSDQNYQREKAKFAMEFQKLEELYQQTTAVIAQANNGQDVRREKGTLTKLQVLYKRLDRYCRQLTVLTYNGSKYDLNLVRKYLLPLMVAEVAAGGDEPSTTGLQPDSRQWPTAITRGTSILCLSSWELKFLDIMMYMSAGTNLDQFIKAFNPNGQQKGCYPYELLRSYADLESITEFPSKSAFYSTLKNGNITDEQYQQARLAWDALPVKNMFEYTKYYNCLDVEPFLEGCVRMAETYWTDFGVDIFKEALSIPGVCLSYLFKTLHKVQPSTRFGLFGESEGALCEELYSKKSLCGGLAFIGQRIAVKDETPIRNQPNKLVKKVVGYDYNALYLYAIMQDMPTGYPDHWQTNETTGCLERKSQKFEDVLKQRKCHGEVEYLKFRAWLDNIYIHHAEHGPQTVLGIHGYRVDGFAKDAQPKPKVYNYNGCYYHYHNEGCLNKRLNLTTADKSIKEKDALKDKELTEMGFDIDTTWECEWFAVKAVAKRLKNNQYITLPFTKFIPLAEKYNEYQQLYPPREFQSLASVNEADMLDAIMQDKVFGFVKVDINTDENKKALYEDFPPIIKHADVGREDIGPYMCGLAEKYGSLQKPKDCLIGSYSGEQVWLMTPLLKFYQRHGVTVKKIYAVVQYDREKAFEWFGHKVTEKRIEGDRNKAAMGTLADVYKTIGNSSYGKTITNLKKHKDVRFTDTQEAGNRHNDAYHHKTDQIAEDCFQLCRRKEAIHFNLPMVIGLSVYFYAKLRMLQFIYDVLFEYVSKDDFMFLESDTDSIYLALAADTLEELVIPEKRAEFDRIKGKFFVQDESQKRIPGLLKVEKSADKFIGLCAKCYICGDDAAKAKGTQQRRNKEILSFENFRKVLFDLPGANFTAFNVGIGFLSGDVHTYVQKRRGLSNLYFKRICLPDGTTKPLDL